MELHFIDVGLGNMTLFRFPLLAVITMVYRIHTPFDCTRSTVVALAMETSSIARTNKADVVYESCGRFLREITRDKTRFPLVFKELTSYGFRRNLWGMKPSGIAIASVGLFASVVAAVWNLEVGIRAAALIASAANVLLLVWWLFRITSNWVRLAGLEYGRALLASCEILKPEPEEADC